MANYLYNGYELPDINAVWTDKVTYPYARITNIPDFAELPGYFYLFLHSSPIVYDGTRNVYTEDGVVSLYHILCSSPELEEMAAAEGATMEEFAAMLNVGLDSYSHVWTIHNVAGGYDDTNSLYLWVSAPVKSTVDNSIYLDTSDPVPVGGEPETPETPETTTPDFAIIPCADYKAACDAIRAKTNKTALIKSGDMASEIASVPTGGGGGGKIELVEGAVYKAQETSETNVYIVVDGTALTLTEFFLASFGVEMDFPCYIVDALPDTMEAGSVYIISSSGIAYMSDEGTSAAAYTMGSALSLTDKGWVDDITTIDATDTANYGVYCQRGGVVDVYYTYTDGKFVLKSEVADTDTVIVVDESITYTSGDNLYLHDENGWKGYKIADKYFECTLDISKDTLTLPTELIDALISNSYEKIITEGEYTVNMKVGFATFSTNSHVHRDATFDSGTLDYSRAGNVIGMGFTICNTIVASNRVKIYYIYFNKWDGANTLTLNTASEITYDRGDTITQTVEEIDRSALTAVKCTFTIHTAEQLV